MLSSEVPIQVDICGVVNEEGSFDAVGQIVALRRFKPISRVHNKVRLSHAVIKIM